MSKSPPASLASLSVQKGSAKPVDATKPIAPVPAPALAVESTPKAEPAVSPAVKAERSPTQFLATKSLTVKVDVATYGKLKAHGGAMGGKTNQDIFIEALSLYFDKYQIK